MLLVPYICILFSLISFLKPPVKGLTDFIQRLQWTPWRPSARFIELLGEQASLSQRGRLRLELGLLLGPVGLSRQDPVEQLLRHRLATPLLWRDARGVHQRLPLVLFTSQFRHC